MNSDLASVRWRERQHPGGKPVRIRLLGTFTTDTLVPHLGLALAELGIIAEISAGPYNQIVQECCDPHSETARWAPDVLVVWPRLEDITGEPQRLENLDTIATAMESATRRMSAHLVAVLPATPSDRPLGAGDASYLSGVGATAAAVRERLRTRLAGTAGAVLCDADQMVRIVGEPGTYDRRLEVLAGIPYSERFLAEAGAAIARAIRLAIRPTIKAIVLDADGTLWGGPVGELGADAIDLGPGPGEAYLHFQQFLLGLRANGVLLALCSKNIEQDVWSALERHDIRLHAEHLSAWRISWRPKHESIREIAAHLNIGVDAMMLIDDNPAELAEAKEALPELTTVMMPADPVRWREMLDCAAFDWLPPNDDDRARPRRIAESRLREQLALTVAPESYLKDLNIWAMARTPDRSDIRRLAQLTLKTSQMNLNGLRLTEQELATLSDSDEHEIRVFEAGDRFGDYGQIGAYMLAFDSNTARLALFLVSCRALGRGIEQFMIADAEDVASKRGADQILASVTDMPRNEPARTFFAGIGCQRPHEEYALASLGTPPYVASRRHGAGHG